jgi:hypothetical protein
VRTGYYSENADYTWEQGGQRTVPALVTPAKVGIFGRSGSRLPPGFRWDDEYLSGDRTSGDNLADRRL